MKGLKLDRTDCGALRFPSKFSHKSSGQSISDVPVFECEARVEYFRNASEGYKRVTRARVIGGGK